MPVGGDTVSDHSANLRNAQTSQSDAAKLLKVSERSVNTAKKVLREGAPELIDAVQQGKVSVSAAADIATLPQPQLILFLASLSRASGYWFKTAPHM